MAKQSGSLDLAFHALADPSRRSMLEQLCVRRASVTELAAPLDLALPTVMRHLGVLEECGFVRSEKVGRIRTFRILKGPLTAAGRWIGARRTERERSQDRLRKHLR